MSEGEHRNGCLTNSRAAKPRLLRLHAVDRFVLKPLCRKACRWLWVVRCRSSAQRLSSIHAYSVFRGALGVFACCSAGVDFVPITPRMPACRDTHGFTATSQPGTPHHEAYVPTQQPPPQAQARLPRSHAHPRGPLAAEAPAHQGPPQALCLECGSSSLSGQDLVSDPSTARGYGDGPAGSQFYRPEDIAQNRRWVSLPTREWATLSNATGQSVG